MKSLVKSDIFFLEKIVEVENPGNFYWNDLFKNILSKIKDVKDKYIIKVNLIKSTRNKLYFHIIYLNGIKGIIEDPFYPRVLNPESRVSNSQFVKGVSCLIIPTGIGASCGGFAGDANPIAKLLSKSYDFLVTHPNVVNGAVLTDLPENIVYVEGFLMDQFLSGKIYLTPNNKNKIGVIFDKGIPDERLEYELNVLNALRVFYGCDIAYWTQTEKPIKVSPYLSEYSFSSGNLEGFEYIIERALKLKELGATALAICCVIPDVELNPGYLSGSGVDPIGGVESIISHTISAISGLVSAHAPVIEPLEMLDYKDINPVSASEYIAKTFLPSVISGLRFAPQIRDQRAENRSQNQELMVDNVSCVVVPYNAFGSAGVFNLVNHFKEIVLVRENKTCLKVNPEDLNLNFKVVNSYLDILNNHVIENSGIDLSVLKRPVCKIPRLFK